MKTTSYKLIISSAVISLLLVACGGGVSSNETGTPAVVPTVKPTNTPAPPVTYAYVVNNVNPPVGITKCVVSASDGLFSNCTMLNNNMSNLVHPQALTFVESVAYIVDQGQDLSGSSTTGFIERCEVNQNDGTFSACSLVQNDMENPSDIVTDANGTSWVTTLNGGVQNLGSVLAYPESVISNTSGSLVPSIVGIVDGGQGPDFYNPISLAVLGTQLFLANQSFPYLYDSSLLQNWQITALLNEFEISSLDVVEINDLKQGIYGQGASGIAAYTSSTRGTVAFIAQSTERALIIVPIGSHGNFVRNVEIFAGIEFTGLQKIRMYNKHLYLALESYIGVMAIDETEPSLLDQDIESTGTNLTGPVSLAFYTIHP